MSLAGLLHGVFSDQSGQVRLLDDEISDVSIDLVRNGEQGVVEFTDVAFGLHRTFLHHIVELELDGLDAGYAEEEFEQAPRSVPERQFEGGDPTGARNERTFLAAIPQADIPSTAAFGFG